MEQLTLDQYRNGDICRNRSRDNENSRAAHARLVPHKQQQREEVFTAICESGERGITCKELAEKWGVGMNTISGRFSELKAEDSPRIRVDGRRNGCGVYKSVNAPDSGPRSADPIGEGGEM